MNGGASVHMSARLCYALYICVSMIASIQLKVTDDVEQQWQQLQEQQ